MYHIETKNSLVTLMEHSKKMKTYPLLNSFCNLHMSPLAYTFVRSETPPLSYVKSLVLTNVSQEEHFNLTTIKRN